MKTLKDITTYAGTNNNGVDKRELRAEAIKWCDDVNKTIDKMTQGSFLHNEESKAFLFNLQGKRQFIKHFFNITDEDLK